MRVTGIHLTIVQAELILMYLMWACVHKNHSSWLEQDNAETVGGVATQSTVPVSLSVRFLIAFLWLPGFQLTIFRTGKYSFTVTSLFLPPALSPVLFILRWLIESISGSALIITERSEAW